MLRWHIVHRLDVADIEGHRLDVFIHDTSGEGNVIELVKNIEELSEVSVMIQCVGCIDLWFQISPSAFSKAI